MRRHFEKYFAAYIIVAVVALIVGIITIDRPSHQFASVPCVPAPGEMCIPDAYYQEYLRYLDLRKQVMANGQTAAARAALNQADQLQGMTDRLNAAIPAGFQLDPKKLVFVPLPAPPKPFTPEAGKATPHGVQPAPIPQKAAPAK
jgi:hypothetical protein